MKPLLKIFRYVLLICIIVIVLLHMSCSPDPKPTNNKITSSDNDTSIHRDTNDDEDEIMTENNANPDGPGDAYNPAIVTGESSESLPIDPLDDLATRMLSMRPPLGPVFVVDLANENDDRELLARSLQGVVNRTIARLYLIDSDGNAAFPDSEQAALDIYLANNLVNVQQTGTLDDALVTFASEASGYVLADPAQSWTINAATTIAAVENAIIATPTTVTELEAINIPLIDDVRNRWLNETHAYWATALRYRDQLAYPGLANQGPGSHQLRDFLIQQGIFTMYTRPSQASFLPMALLTATFPKGRAYYGYVADNRDEEILAVGLLSILDQILVPSTRVSNLSFHIAVGTDRPRAILPEIDLADVAPCTCDTVNVVIAISDGDNVSVPINQYLRDPFWESEARGTLPIGWSISPNVAILAPALWDHFVSTISPNDELINMLGTGYVYPVVHPRAKTYMKDAFTIGDRLGLRAFWTLEPLGYQIWPSWFSIEAALPAGAPSVILSGYELMFPGQQAIIQRPSGIVALISQTPEYILPPEQYAQFVQDLIDTPALERPLVTFFFASNWSNDMDRLAEYLVPLASDKVRFLTPSQASACLQ